MQLLKSLKAGLKAVVLAIGRIQHYLQKFRWCENQKAFIAIYRSLLLLLLPDPFREMGHGGRPWSPGSRATSKGLDQRSQRDRESPKSERRKESVAALCRMR